MRTTTTNHIPKNVTRLEKEVYASLKRRARFVGLTIDELCRRAKIAPSTFSRWVNGHHSGLIFTIGQMDEILTKLEAEKFHTLEKRIHACGLTISGACSEVDIPVLDYNSNDTGLLQSLCAYQRRPTQSRRATLFRLLLWRHGSAGDRDLNGRIAAHWRLWKVLRVCRRTHRCAAQIFSHPSGFNETPYRQRARHHILGSCLPSQHYWHSD